MKRRRNSQNNSAKQVANRALRIARGVQAAVERKYVITVFERSGLISTGNVFYLNKTNQDIGDVGERIGDSIKCVRLRASLQFVQPPALTGSHAFRMAIVHDKQDTLANAGNLYIGPGTNHVPMLQYTKDYRLQYGVIYDSFPVTLDQYNPTVAIRMDRSFNIATRYIQGSDDITTGALKVVFLSDLAGSSPTYVTVSGTIRVDYTDS